MARKRSLSEKSIRKDYILRMNFNRGRHLYLVLPKRGKKRKKEYYNVYFVPRDEDKPLKFKGRYSLVGLFKRYPQAFKRG